MLASSATPDSDLIYSLYTGGFKPQIVRMALLLDVFTPLAGGPADADAVARACGCSPTGIAPLLDYLTGVKLLEKEGARYALTLTATTFLVPRGKAYVGDLILAFTGTALWDRVLQAIRAGEPRPLTEFFDQDAWLESYSTWRISNSLEMWQAAGVRPQERSSLDVLDIACGCAIKSLVLARDAPAVRLTCVDALEVLTVARDLAGRMGVLAQVSFRPGDLQTADLGEGQYDVCLVGQITHYLTEAQDRDLFRRIHRALRAEGILVIDVPMATSEPSESIGFLTLVLWANSGGRAYPFETYCDWLEDVGFRDVTSLGKRWLSARA